MENDLIRRSELLANFDGIYDCCDLVFEPNDKCCKVEDCSHCKFYPIKRALRKLVERAPAVDAVEVVRCQECILHDNCRTEDVFKFAGLNDGKRFCGVGQRREEKQHAPD